MGGNISDSKFKSRFCRLLMSLIHLFIQKKNVLSIYYLLGAKYYLGQQRYIREQKGHRFLSPRTNKCTKLTEKF